MFQIFAILVINFYFHCANAYEIALTFDDLPGSQNGSIKDLYLINERILKGLKQFNAPAFGFVNEGLIYQNGHEAEKIAILKLWVDKGQLLGNHTYSHNSLNETNLYEFEQDVIKGSTISRKLMNDAKLEYKYFRHPYLHTGITPEIRSSFEGFLTKEGYIIAPATVDTDDWKFNQELLKNPQDQTKIIQEYLTHSKKKFLFYEKASKKIFGRNIKQIWLLHDNLINSLAIKDILKLALDLGYNFITLDQALADKAYSEPDNYYQKFGVSWLYRWDYTRGKVVDWSKDPEPDLL